MHIQRFMPLLMTILGFGVMGLLALRSFVLANAFSMRVAIVAFAVTYIVWMIYESRVTRAEIDKSHSSNDRFSMELAAVVKIMLLASLLIFVTSTPVWAFVLGFILAWSGILLRAWAIRVLGNSYSHRIRIPEKIVSDGPYGMIRHPAYLGTAFAHAGFTLVFWNLVSACLLLAWFFVVWLRVFLEEKAFSQEESYLAYAKKVKFKLLPFIW